MLIIKKRVSLDFLGDEYEKSYVNVRAISVSEYDEIKKSEKSVKDTVLDRFVSGEIDQNGKMTELTRENLEELPGEVFVEAFNQMLGKIDPKPLAQ